MLDIEYLNNLLNNNEVDNNRLTFDIYLTLLALNNKQYQNNHYDIEINVLEDFLRKVNNLKVKIQLKRKETEIDELLASIRTIYEQNKQLIDKYNQDNIDIISVLNSKEPLSITNIIDKLTKLKITKLANQEKYNKLRNDIVNSIFVTEYYIDSFNLYLGNMTIPLTDFYEMFDYLLDINNYKPVYQQEITNSYRIKTISELINKIKVNQPVTTYIPVILTILFSKQLNSDNIDTTKFNIENIKISELYSFLSYDGMNTAKWKRVSIPNEYLYSKIKTAISNGMYYISNNIFTIDIMNDFKVSILIEDLVNFIKENINKAYL